MESSSNETKYIIQGYVIYLMKLKVKNLIFSIKTLWQALVLSFLKKFLDKRPVLLLYWFGDQQQTSAVRCQNYASFYSKFNAQLVERTSSSPKQYEIA